MQSVFSARETPYLLSCFPNSTDFVDQRNDELRTRSSWTFISQWRIENLRWNWSYSVTDFFFACRKILALYCKPERQRFRCNMKLNCKKFNILITCTTYPELWTKFRKGETSVEFLNSWDSFFCSFTKIFLPGMSPSISIFILVKVRVYYLKIW